MTAWPRIGILGAGAAGTAAARTLNDSGATLTAELVTTADQPPFNRTLVNKGVAVGLITPEQARLPLPGTDIVSDTAVGVDTDTGAVRLASGGRRAYDALIIATGSSPRQLDPGIIPGVTEAVGTGKLTALHSLDDACRVRDVIAATPHPARVIILGAGLLASETASLLHDAGHDTIMVARAALPGVSVFGATIAQTLADEHRAHATTYFGRDIRALSSEGPGITVRLDDGTQITGDLVIVAHGTVPAAPAPWGSSGVPVTSALRHVAPRAVPVYAAGGVARIRDDLIGEYRIDHWGDATAQGAHAARAVLHDLGMGDDPQRYLPVSSYVSRIYGHTIAGIGLAASGGRDRQESADPLLVVREYNGTPVAAHGINAGAVIRQWKSMLFR